MKPQTVGQFIEQINSKLSSFKGRQFERPLDIKGELKAFFEQVLIDTPFKLYNNTIRLKELDIVNKNVFDIKIDQQTKYHGGPTMVRSAHISCDVSNDMLLSEYIHQFKIKCLKENIRIIDCNIEDLETDLKKLQQRKQEQVDIINSLAYNVKEQ